MELAAMTTDIDGARRLAQELGGRLYCDARENWQKLPFRALLTATTDDITAMERIADVGLSLICRRTVKDGPKSHIGLFPVVRKPSLSHQQADAHWRDVHAPLALVHHAAMSFYHQCSVVHHLSGAQFDGFAMCGFESHDDFRNNFYSTPESVKIISDDVALWAAIKQAPNRLIAQESDYRQTSQISYAQ